MTKIFFATLFAVFLSLQSFCGASARIETAYFNGNSELKYPIVHTNNADVDEKINVAIIAEIDRFVTGIERNAQTNNYEIGGMYTSFEVPCNRAGNTVILSIVIIESSYFKGAAHPSTYMHTLNFNAETGEIIDLKYLTDVGDGSNQQYSLTNISEKLREKVARTEILLFNDALPLKNMPECFYFDKNLHVHFIFQQYEVAPYATGIIDLDMDA